MLLADQDFHRLREYMYANYGINLEKKKGLIEGRLSSVVAQAGHNSFKDYVDAALTDKTGVMINTLVAKLTTNYTYFMREEAHYKFLYDHALPEWTKRIRDFDLRTWSAGCSSGEEAYNLAMMISEYFGPNKGRWDMKVLATDISPKVLAMAKEGVYKNNHIASLPENLRKKYFNPHGNDTSKVSPQLADDVVFGPFNLMNQFKFRKKFHIIFCRNVMIYFDDVTKSRLIDKFYDALMPGGYLFIGLSESMPTVDAHWQTVAPSIYRKG